MRASLASALIIQSDLDVSAKRTRTIGRHCGADQPPVKGPLRRYAPLTGDRPALCFAQVMWARGCRKRAGQDWAEAGADRQRRAVGRGRFAVGDRPSAGWRADSDAGRAVSSSAGYWGSVTAEAFLCADPGTDQTFRLQDSSFVQETPLYAAVLAVGGIRRRAAARAPELDNCLATELHAADCKRATGRLLLAPVLAVYSESDHLANVHVEILRLGIGELDPELLHQAPPILDLAGREHRIEHA